MGCANSKEQQPQQQTEQKKGPEDFPTTQDLDFVPGRKSTREDVIAKREQKGSNPIRISKGGSQLFNMS
jgi:hypothetical protein